MSAREVVEAVLLSSVVLSCAVGSIGMLRMKEPMQAMHYLSLPACAGSVLLIAAVFVETGSSQASWKTVLIGGVLLAFNSVVTHATARAFRTKEVGQWQPRPGDGAEFVPRESKA